MTIDATRLLSVIREIEQMPQDELKELDRKLLLSIKLTLQLHKSEVDKILSRLAFLDEQQLN